MLSFWFDNHHYVGFTVESARKRGVPEAVIQNALRLWLKAQADRLRSATAAQGITAEGVKVGTDPESLALLHSAAKLAKPINWQTDKGFVVLTADQVASIETKVGTFIQAGFDKLQQVYEQIDKGTLSTLTAIETAGWPTS